MRRVVVKISLFSTAILASLFLVSFAHAATQWVTNPASCNQNDATNFPGQNCPGSTRICGDNSGIAQCYLTSGLTAPGLNGVASAYNGSLTAGGYVVNCYSTVDAGSPFCDNNTNFWCNSDSSCYGQNRTTTCAAGKFAYESGAFSCGSCMAGYADCNGDAGSCEIRFGSTTSSTHAHTTWATCNTTQCSSGYTDCNGSGDGSDADGCEVQNGGACSISGLPGTYSGCFCSLGKQYFETNTEARYASSGPFLWGRNYGIGDLISFGNATSSNIFNVSYDGVVRLATTTAPADASDRLYNIGGDLFWNGTKIGEAPSSSSSGTLSWATSLLPVTGLHPDGDDDTGFGADGSDHLWITTNGVSRMYFDGNGNIGIGTTSSQNILNVAGGVTLSSTTPANTIDSLYNLGGALYWNGSPVGSGSSSSFWIANGNDIYSGNTGNVGIGTTTPAQQLHLYKAANLNNFGIKIENNWTVDGNADLWLKSGADTGGISYGSSVMRIYTGGTDDIILRAGGTDRLTVLDTGNVGIGTVTPPYKLSIDSHESQWGNPSLYIHNYDSGTDTGLSQISLDAQGSGGLHGYLKMNAVTSDDGTGGANITYSGDINEMGLIIGTAAGNGPLSFFVSNTTAIAISPDTGFVDIGGNFVPSNKLQVEGAITLVSATPATTTNALYNASGHLYWNGSDLSAGTSKWTLAGAGPNVYRANGNVGIGLSNPASKLHIRSTGAGDVELLRFDNDNNVDHRLYIPDGTNIAVWEFNASGDGGALQFNNDGSEVAKITNTGLIVNDDGGATAKLRVEGVGQPNLLYTDPINNRVGIGTATPTEALTIATSSGEQYVLIANKDYGIGTRIGHDADHSIITGDYWGNDRSLIIQSGSGYYWARFDVDGYAHIGQNADGNGYAVNIIDGRVGINTSVMPNMLTVAGAISITSSSPITSTYALYNQGGKLYWNGQEVISTGTSKWTLAGAGPNVYRSSGNVGIGTSNPLAKLSVDDGNNMVASPSGDLSIVISTDGGDTFIETHSTDMSEGLIMHGTIASDYGVVRQLSSGDYAAGWERGLHIFTNDAGGTSDPIIFRTDGSEAMRINDNGTVGIGTVAATSILGLAGENVPAYPVINSVPSLYIRNEKTFDAQGHSQIRLASRGNSSVGDSTLDLSISQLDDATVDARLWVNHPSDNIGGWVDDGFIIGTGPKSGSLLFFTSSTRRMTIAEGSGYVGIGTSAPSARLDVQGSGPETALRVIGTNSVIAQFINGDVPNGFLFGSDLYGGETGLYEGTNGALIAGHVLGDYNTVMLGQYVMYLKQDTQRVGINMTSPQNTLDVNGGISISSTSPATTSMALYNLGGALYWNGSPVGSAGATGTAFVQGGNSFAGLAELGTNDQNSLSLETENVTRMTIASPAQDGGNDSARIGIGQNPDPNAPLAVMGHTRYLMTLYADPTYNTSGHAEWFIGFPYGDQDSVAFDFNREGGANSPLNFFSMHMWGDEAGEALAIHDQGKVGIGTLSGQITSSVKFQVDSTDAGVLIPRLTTGQRDSIAGPVAGLLVYNSTSNTFDYFNGSSWNGLLTASGVSNLWTQNGFNTYLASASNKVGIGTSTPAQKLHVYDSAEFAAAGLLVENNFSIAGNATLWLKAGQGNGNTASLTYNGSNGLLTLATPSLSTSSIGFDTNGSTRMKIESAGNVTIGNPFISSAKLHIKGDTDDSTTNGLRIDNNSGNPLFMVRNDGQIGIGTTTPAYGGYVHIYKAANTANVGMIIENGGTYGNNADLWLRSNGNGEGHLTMDASGFSFITTNGKPEIFSPNGSTIMTLTASGTAIGAGISSPQNVLHVNGGISINSTTPATTSMALYNLSGQLYWNGYPLATGTSIGGSLDSAYDFGGSGAGRQITVDSGPVLLTGATGGIGALLVNYGGTGQAIHVANTSSGDAFSAQNTGSGHGLAVRNGGTGYGIRVMQNTVSGSGVWVENEYGGSGFLLDNKSDGLGINLNNERDGTGIMVANNGDGFGMRIAQSSAAGTGLYIRQNDGIGIVLDNNTANTGFALNVSGTGDGMYIYKSTAAKAVDIYDVGGKTAFYINKPLNGGNAVEVNTDDGARAFYAMHNGSGEAFWMRNIGTGASLWIEDSASDYTPFILDASGRLAVSTSSTTNFTLTSGGSVGPDLSNAYDLGSASYSWRNLYVSGTIYGNIVTNQPAGSVLFASSTGAIWADNGNFYWDDTNNRLGINTPSPQNALHIVGSARATTGFSANNGTAGSPAFYFTSDADVGIFTPGTNMLAFTTGGTEKLRISSNGRVGIGTSSPQAKLHLFATSSNSQSILLTNENGIGIEIGHDGSHSFIETDYFGNDRTFTIKSNSGYKQAYWAVDGEAGFGNSPLGNYAININSGGNVFIPDSMVGIGTANPSTLLHLRKDSSSSTVKGPALTLTNAGSATSSIEFYGTSGDAARKRMKIDVKEFGNTEFSVDDSENQWKKIMALTYGGGTQFYGGDDDILQAYMASGTRVMTLDYNGNLGIGINNPSYKLHVYRTGDGDVAAFRDDTGTCTINPNNSSLSCTSDATQKKNIQTISDSLAKVMQMRGVTFQWSKQTDSSLRIGFVAQEMEEIVPELVTTNADGLKAINYLNFAPLLVNAIKEQQAMIEAVSSSIAIMSANVGETTGLTVLGVQSLTVTGVAEFNGTFNVKEAATFAGTVTVREHVEFAADTVGEAKVLAGTSSVVVTFDKPYATLPVVTISQIYRDDPALFDETVMDLRAIVKDISTTSFTIYIKPTTTRNVQFSWHAFGSSPDAKVFISDGTVAMVNLTVEEIPIEEEVIVVEAPSSSVEETIAPAPEPEGTEQTGTAGGETSNEEITGVPGPQIEVGGESSGEETAGGSMPNETPPETPAETSQASETPPETPQAPTVDPVNLTADPVTPPADPVAPPADPVPEIPPATP